MYATNTHRVSLNRQNRRATAQNAKPVLLGLRVKHLPARQRHHAGLDSLLLKQRSSLDRDRDLGPSRHERQVLILNLVQDISTLDSVLDRRVLELG